MTKIGDEINDLLQELEKEYKVESMQPGDITVKDMERVTGLGHRQCLNILSEKVEKGELIVFKAKNDRGFCVNAYRKKMTVFVKLKNGMIDK
jgi:hypothetical protein